MFCGEKQVPHWEQDNHCSASNITLAAPQFGAYDWATIKLSKDPIAQSSVLSSRTGGRSSHAPRAFRKERCVSHSDTNRSMRISRHLLKSQWIF